MIRFDLDKLDEVLFVVPKGIDKEGYMDEIETSTDEEGKKFIRTRKFRPSIELNNPRYELVLTMMQTLMVYLAEPSEDGGDNIEDIVENAPANVQCAYDTLDEYGLIIKT